MAVDLQINMDPEDGCLWVYGVAEEGVPAFTAFGIECLEEIIAIERAAGRAPPKVGAEHRDFRISVDEGHISVPLVGASAATGAGAFDILTGDVERLGGLRRVASRRRLEYVVDLCHLACGCASSRGTFKADVQEIGVCGRAVPRVKRKSRRDAISKQQFSTPLI
jgi:hypothetical protein